MEQTQKIGGDWIDGDKVLGDKITNIYVNTKDFQELESQLKKLQTQKDKLLERIAKYPEDESFKTELTKVNDDIKEQKQKIESFKADVVRLYETFTKIEINTDRLRLAKAHFDKGEFREADAILNAEEISNEVSLLKKAIEKTQTELAEMKGNLESKANEFLIKAQLWQTFYAEPDWFEKTCEYYEKALDAYRSHEVVFQYAVFLQKHNQFAKAQFLYQEALQIRRELAKENPRTFLPDVAGTLNNLSIFYLQSVPDKEKSIALAKEAADILLPIYEKVPYLQNYLLTALQVLKANGVDFED